MVLLSLFAVDLYWASPVKLAALPLQSIIQFFSHLNHWRIALDLFLLAFSGGLFVVPLYTYLQVVSEGGLRSRTIAANNIINALFMILGTGFVMLLVHFNIAIAHVFFILAVLNVCAALVFWILFLRAQHKV